MANMKEIKERISSISDIMKITNAMYLISSSKLKKARAKLDSTIPYFESIQYTIHHILKHTEDLSHPYFDNGKNKSAEDKVYGYIVVSGDKGMCGAYNHNIMKLADSELEKHEHNAVFAVGSVARAYFQKKGAMVDAEFLYTVQDPAPYRARRIAETITEHFLKGHLDEVYVIFSQLEKSAEVPKAVKLFPLEREAFEDTDLPEERHQTVRFEPSPQAVLDTLVPNYTKGFIYGVLIEAFCAEQNARMTAMDSATSSAKDMIAQLTLDYNRARQAAITQEITEIVSGARSQHR